MVDFQKRPSSDFIWRGTKEFSYLIGANFTDPKTGPCAWNENLNVLPYSTTKMPLSTLIEKNKFSHAYIASRSSRSLHGVTTQVKPQVAPARNMSIGDKRHCCVTSKYKDLYGKKIYRFCNLRKWKDFNKKQLTLLKMCVTWSKGRFMAILWFLCKPFSLPWTTQERLKHTF